MPQTLIGFVSDICDTAEGFHHHPEPAWTISWEIKHHISTGFITDMISQLIHQETGSRDHPDRTQILSFLEGHYPDHPFPEIQIIHPQTQTFRCTGPTPSTYQDGELR